MTSPLFGKQVFKKKETEDRDNKSSEMHCSKVQISCATNAGIKEKEN